MPLRDLGRLRENEWFSKSQMDGKGDRQREGVVWESSIGAQALVLWKALHVSP